MKKPYPLKVVDKARQLVKTGNRAQAHFENADDALQAAIDAKDTTAEQYWRDVFAVVDYLVAAALKQQFPAKVVAQAQRMVRSPSPYKRYRKAEDALQAAIDARDKDTEKYWRDVFAVYGEMVLLHIPDVGDIHLSYSAAGYACGALDPRTEEPNCSTEPDESDLDPTAPPYYGVDEDIPF
jgi:hypothetical protein